MTAAAECFPPGTFLRDELKARNMRQLDLAKALGVCSPYVSDIINGRRDISPQIALGLERVLGVSAETWGALQWSWKLWLRRTGRD